MFGPNTWDRLEVDIRYHLPFVWNHYILLLKIHWTDGSSTISTSDFPCLHGVPEVFFARRTAPLRRSMALVLSKELLVWPPRMENRKTCGSGVLNLLRHSFELTSLTAWLFFSDVFWISFSLMTFQILTELTLLGLHGSVCSPVSQMCSSKLDTLQFRFLHFSRGSVLKRTSFLFLPCDFSARSCDPVSVCFSKKRRTEASSLGNNDGLLNDLGDKNMSI